MINSKPSGREFSQTLFLNFLEGILFSVSITSYLKTAQNLRISIVTHYWIKPGAHLQTSDCLHIMQRNSNRSREETGNAFLPFSFFFQVFMKDHLNFLLIILVLILAEYKQYKGRISWLFSINIAWILSSYVTIWYTRTQHAEFWTY